MSGLEYILCGVCLLLFAAACVLGALLAGMRAEKEKLQRGLEEKENELSDNQRELELQITFLKAYADIYNTLHVVNLNDNTIREYKTSEEIKELGYNLSDARGMMKKVIQAFTVPEYLDSALEFTDLSTLADRMRQEKTIAGEFKGVNFWYRGRFVVIDRDESGRPIHVSWATMIVQEEKSREESLIKTSLTDKLTGLENRRALEEHLQKSFAEGPKDVTLISMDLNGLKVTNDTLGHAAGDELLQGAAGCMKDVFGAYGRLYRTGGDEFVAVLQGVSERIPDLTGKLEALLAGWEGESIKGISISYGFVNCSEFPEAGYGQLLKIADERMYEMKRAYYSRPGMDRRQRRTDAQGDDNGSNQ